MKKGSRLRRKQLAEARKKRIFGPRSGKDQYQTPGACTETVCGIDKSGQSRDVVKERLVLDLSSQRIEKLSDSRSMVYLDYNATTPLAPEVIDEITVNLRSAWGNPSSSYATGVKAKDVIVTAREQVANMIGATSNDIIFTSGGTESNNWVLQTALQYFDNCHSNIDKGMGDTGTDGTNSRKRLPHFVTSNIEHDAIKLVLENFQRNNLADVTFVPVRHTTGAVDTEDVMAAITPNTVMVSVMLANNETGIIQPVSEICCAVRALNQGADEKRRILLHTDAAQAFGKIPVDVNELGVDYLTIVGHKFYGPRIGAVFAKSPTQDTPLFPVLFGGGQERGLRPGTENTPMIAGLGKAAELVSKNLEAYRSHMEKVRNYLEKELEALFGEAVCFNGKLPSSQRLPNTCNVSFIGQDLRGHEILAQVPSIHASVGAACHSQQRPSHILISSGIPEDVAAKALRLSVGRETSKQDIDVVVKDLCNALMKSFILIKS